MSDDTDGTAKAAPGWYPTPDGGTKFWDGEQWLDIPMPDGRVATPAAPAEKAWERADLKARSDSRRGWVGIVVLVLLIGGCSYFASRGSSSGSDYDEYGAWGNCKQQMDTTLKAPASAGYPTVSELTWRHTGDQWVFTRAWVDAENSFGAQLRQYFDCTVTETGGNQVNVKVTPVS